MSDSEYSKYYEYEDDNEVVPVPVKKQPKKRVYSKRSDSEETVNLKEPTIKKRKAPTSKRSVKSNEESTSSAASRNPFDLFGLLSAEESGAAAEQQQPSSQLPSVLTSRVANGTVTRRKHLNGEFYIEVKVYRTSDAVAARPEERWRKALNSLKIQINPDGDEWKQLQSFFKTIRNSMNDAESVFFANKIN